jgi:hypothetical protein
MDGSPDPPQQSNAALLSASRSRAGNLEKQATAHVIVREDGGLGQRGREGGREGGRERGYHSERQRQQQLPLLPEPEASMCQRVPLGRGRPANTGERGARMGWSELVATAAALLSYNSTLPLLLSLPFLCNFCWWGVGWGRLREAEAGGGRRGARVD